MIEYLKALKDISFKVPLKEIPSFIDNMSFPVATVIIAVLILMAIQGHKIFKSLLYVAASVGLGFVGHLYLAPYITKLVGSKIPESFPLSLDVCIAFVCAMLGVFLAHYAHKFIIFCMGGVGGYFVGYYVVAGLLVKYFSNLPFLKTKLAYILVGCVCALILAIFLLLTFKYLYIFITSVGFMTAACYILSRQMVPGCDYVISACFATLGLIIGIFMMIHQFDEDEKSIEFKF